MFFHNLPRFSTDHDFNLLDVSKQDVVYNKVRQILLRFGTIDDEAKKLNVPILVLNYGKGERMLKVEISNRQYDNHYETKTLAGTDIRVLTAPDMFATSYVLWVKDSHLAMFLMSGFSCSRCMPV